ncbi:choice-of-anchor B family protein [Rubricoccus marinus]|uniref:Secretion system C-terminal sorting domain-containing protein n=1 Tax=Rubricoccus marinus TaxID=716817 RepID=A0A259U451_9BACT|nr:choice-of-anchor B family protein [Rubricoccus marinus]OZC04702.1 hypothetical protein BSZ36_11365 [Rubricoccus marinus]
MLRLPFLALALTLASGAFAQGTCTDGSASFGGTSYSCNGVDVAAVIPVGTTSPFRSGALNDIWGWTDPQDDKEYALVGTRSGVVFVDVSTPASPRVLGKLQTSVPNGFAAWRDVKTYGNYAVVVAEVGGHGMQVFDLTRLRGLSEDSNRDLEEDALYVGIGNAHNIVVDEASGFAYAVGARNVPTCGGTGLHMIDIRQPLAPTYAGCFDEDGYTHDAQCVVYDGPDTDHTGKQICLASNEDTLTIVDVTDKSSPIQIARGFYPNPSYTHQGWFTEDKKYFIVNDELDNSDGGTRTFVFDVSDLDNPDFTFRYDSPLAVTDHNLYVRGNFVYQSNYEGGLRILDAASIASGTFAEAGHFDTYPQSNNATFNGQWSNYPYFASGTVIASDINNGLFVLRPEPRFFAVAEEPAPEAEAAYALSLPEPNPASERSTLSLRVDAAQLVYAALYDLTGRRVATLLDRAVASGETVALEVNGSALPAGVYVVRVAGETFEASERVSIVR